MHDFAREFPLPLPKDVQKLAIIDRQYREYITEAGITNAKGRRYCEHLYRSMLKFLQNHFEMTKSGFLLGDTPTLFDFGLFASMFRHFSLDPTPSKIMRLTAPNVFAWVSRMWNASVVCCSTENQMNAQHGRIPETWRPIIRLVASDYLPYLIANARAVDANLHRFNFANFVNITPKPFHSWCATKLLRHWEKLPSLNKTQVTEILTQCGGYPLLEIQRI